ncbi:hypothetical protein CBL_03348 [Carabus blaptoides fortunei]
MYWKRRYSMRTHEQFNIVTSERKDDGCKKHLQPLRKPFHHGFLSRTSRSRYNLQTNFKYVLPKYIWSTSTDELKACGDLVTGFKQPYTFYPGWNTLSEYCNELSHAASGAKPLSGPIQTELSILLKATTYSASTVTCIHYFKVIRTVTVPYSMPRDVCLKFLDSVLILPEDVIKFQH